RPYLENIDSSISDFNVQTVNFIIRSAVIVTVEPLLNEFGKTGFGIPVAHVELYNSTIELRKDIILIGSDLVHIEK
uniref:Lipid-binding serum glycoprotein C-terminal domain-containing protein n=1 Tax=Magallana gigas TaxID=29159 RepID=A0A8W8JZH2_MAGGI